jgi:hypothetical protein
MNRVSYEKDPRKRKAHSHLEDKALYKRSRSRPYISPIYSRELTFRSSASSAHSNIEGDDLEDFNASPTSIGTGSSSPATDEILADGSTHPECPIANNATHSFICTSGLEYSDSTEENYFEGLRFQKLISACIRYVLLLSKLIFQLYARL